MGIEIGRKGSDWLSLKTQSEAKNSTPKFTQKVVIMILKYQDHHILGRLGMVGGFCVGGRLGTIGAARVAPPGRDGTIGAMEFIAPIAF